MIQQNHNWRQQYLFDEKQLRTTENLRIALIIEKNDESDATILVEIYEFELTLFCKKWKNISKRDFACSIYKFLMISSIMKEDNFMTESDITNIIVKLQWTYRVMIYEEMQWKMERMTEKWAWKKLDRYVKKKRYTAFNSIRQIIHLTSAIAYDTSEMSQIEWLNDNHEKVNINDKIIELKDIKWFLFNRIEIAKIELKRKILFKHKLKEFEYICMKNEDTLRNKKIEYSFIDCMKNEFVKFKNKLLKTLLKNSLIKSFFIKYVRREKIEWNKD